MTDAVAPEAMPNPTIHIQRTAWGVMVLAFLLFMTFCAISSIGIYYFFFESTVPLNTVVQVGRGTAVITDANFTERGLRLNTTLTTLPTTISTDTQSQVTLSFHNGETDTNLIAALTLRNNTALELRQALTPRFVWGRGQQVVNIRNFQGALDALVGPNTRSDGLITIETTQGARIQLLAQGRYTLDVSANRVSVTVRSGHARLYSIARDQISDIHSGQQGTIIISHGNPIVKDARNNLIENSLITFAIPDVDLSNNAVAALPARWGCTTNQRELPRGAYRADIYDGREVLRLVRSDGATANGEVRCKQIYAEPGQDVQDFNYLELEATFLINFQSVSRCGVAGSECPLMLQIVYEDVNGINREWLQGFYYNNGQQQDYPLRCTTCVAGLAEHQQINEKAWYTYRSGNLFPTLAALGEPAYIRSVEFYASGHEFDTSVGEVALIAGIADAVLPSVPSE